MTTHSRHPYKDSIGSSHSVITQRIELYQPVLDMLGRLPAPRRAVNLGPREGDWLAVLSAHGFDTRSVDLDERAVELGATPDLPGRAGDKLETLERTSDDSLALVSTFHSVEHINFETLFGLVKHAHRTLTPGGVLIVQTASPKKSSGYDPSFCPSHNKPIPSALLAFLTDYHGFAAHTVMFTPDHAPLTQSQVMSNTDTVTQPCPEYAIVAIKGGNDSALESFHVWASLNGDTRIEALSQCAYESLEDQLVFRDTLLNELAHLKSLHHETTEKLERVCSSNSWRLTRPLRVLVRLIAACRRKQGGSLKKIISDYVRSNHKHGVFVVTWLKRLKLSKLANKLAGDAKQSHTIKEPAVVDRPLSTLAPDVRQTYALILSEIQPRKDD